MKIWGENMFAFAAVFELRTPESAGKRKTIF